MRVMTPQQPERPERREPRDKPTVLLVENDSELRDVMVFNLAGEGFEVVTAETGESALLEIGRTAPDVIIAGRTLQGVNGLTVCQAIKTDAELYSTPVIVICQGGDESEVLSGFEHGADDVLVKPISHRELLARVNALLRRRTMSRQLPEPGAIQMDSLVINPERHEVRIGERTIDLTATEFKLLLLLARARGRVLTREQIVRSVHEDGKDVTERSVDVLIVMLRRKLGDHGKNIETVRGVGYRLAEALPTGWA